MSDDRYTNVYEKRKINIFIAFYTKKKKKTWHVWKIIEWTRDNNIHILIVIIII